MKRFVKSIVNKFGVDVVKLDVIDHSSNPYCQNNKVSRDIIDIEKLGGMSLSIPGMITPDSGKYLYALCYMQELKGDVVEIGSWQGRSTIFLASAVNESKNGRFYAIDHFGGNVGKEEHYVVNGSLNGLKESFEENISRFKLSKVVNLLNMPNTDAFEIIKNNTIRFLFIDGDHTKSGVKKDIELFFPRLVKGSIIVFDDYFNGFPGLIEAANDVINEYNPSRVFYYRHTLVLKL